MILLNMMIGVMALLIGSIILIAVIIVEAIFLSKSLAGKWMKSKVFFTVLLSNLVSTIVGRLILLSWFWDYIVVEIKKIFGLPEDFTSPHLVIGFIVFAFILTLFFEIPLNLLFLRRDFENRRIIINSIYANMVTYILVGVLSLIIA